MPKIDSRSGSSLADSYDTVGSKVGIDNLETRDVNLVHEMGGTLVSERLTSEIFRVQTGSIAQSTAFDADFSQVLPTGIIMRVLGLAMIVDTANRVSNCAIVARANLADQEIPLIINDGSEDPVRMQDDGAAVALLQTLGSDGAMIPQIPTLLIGSGVRNSTVNTLFLRGVTSGFGAGTVQITGLAHIAFARPEGVSSAGLPVPSW